MPPIHLHYLSAPDVAALALSDDEIIGAVEAGLAAQGRREAVIEPRVHLVPDPAVHGHFNVLRGAFRAPINLAGVKVIGDYVDNYKHDLPSELALLTLYRAETGTPVAILDATRLTWMRTGAVSAIGAKHLARPDSKVLAHIGARGTAWYNLRYLDHLFGFDQIRVTSRRPESRERFAEVMSGILGKPVVATENVESAVQGADVIVDATRLSQEQTLLRNEWIAPGALVMPYGAVRSTDPRLPHVADKFVVDDWRQATASEFGHYHRLINSGQLTQDDVYAEIGQIVAGLRPGRESAEETIVFWHRGFAISDIAIGSLAMRKARARNVGTTVVYATGVRES
jgi:ornithine cyclodeaminase/alanine dehydrogenase-like protein (mu-crystallin family)